MTHEQTTMVEKNHNLIYSFLRKYNLRIEEYYDLAAIGLCKAAIAFDPSKSAFSTFAYQCMLNEVGRQARKDNSAKQIPSGCLVYFQQELENSNGDTMSMENILPSIENTEEQVVSETVLKEYVVNMKERDRMIILLLANGYKQREVCRMVGCSQPQVSRVKRSLEFKMRG